MADKIHAALEHYKKGEWEKAIDAFSCVLETVPDSAEIYNNMGICYAQLGDFEHAAKHYLRACELNPKAAQVYINLSDIYYRLRDFESGINLLSRSIDELPEHLPLRHLLARFYMEDSKLDLAIDELEKVLDAEPENYDAYYDLGRVHFELGNWALAAENFENVVEVKQNEWVLFNLAEAYEANNEVDKAISNYLKAITHNEGFKPAYKKLGVLFLARRDYDDAVEYFQDYIKSGVPDEEIQQVKGLIERIKKLNHI
jgi:tetratricopeptide (TPR) repeat protein